MIYNAKHFSKSTYYINTIKTNYGEFNNCFAAVKLWNHLESYKHLPLKMFQKKLRWTSCSLTVDEFSTGIYLFILFIYLFFFLFFTNNCFAQALVPIYLLYSNII